MTLASPGSRSDSSCALEAAWEAQCRHREVFNRGVSQCMCTCAGKCTLHGPDPIGQRRALHPVAAAALLVSAHRTLRVGSDEAVRAPLRSGLMSEPLWSNSLACRSSARNTHITMGLDIEKVYLRGAW